MIAINIKTGGRDKNRYIKTRQNTPVVLKAKDNNTNITADMIVVIDTENNLRNNWKVKEDLLGW